VTYAGDAALTRGQVSEAVDPLGWRLILGVVTTHVLASSLDEAARAVTIAVSAAGTDGTGHLTAEVTPGRAVLRLHTAVRGAVTGTDLALARRITEALAAESLTTVAGDAVPPQTIEIAIDALDIARVRPFWQAARCSTPARHRRSGCWRTPRATRRASARGRDGTDRRHR
jgi:4a-hydroxytetrahydrobiopterin dehydratase